MPRSGSTRSLTCTVTCSRWLLSISKCLRVARMLNIKGEFLTTRLIRKSTYHKNYYSFSELPSFESICTELELKNMRKLLHLPVLSVSKKISSIFYKSPLTLTPKSTHKLSATLQIIRENNPYNPRQNNETHPDDCKQ